MNGFRYNTVTALSPRRITLSTLKPFIAEEKRYQHVNISPSARFTFHSSLSWRIQKWFPLMLCRVILGLSTRHTITQQFFTITRPTAQRVPRFTVS
jgi:hypothetical protein